MPVFTDHTRGAQGNPEYLVIFLHGYGGNGHNIIDRLNDFLSPLLPQAKLVCPDAPMTVPGNPEGAPWRQWFSVEGLDEDPDRYVIAERTMEQAPIVNAYIDEVMKRENVPADRVILAGFSQGATMAIYAGLTRDTPLAGIFSISGGAIDALPYVASKTPVALVVGGLEYGEWKDGRWIPNDYSGPSQLPRFEAHLQHLGISGLSRILPNVAHDLSREAMIQLAAMARVLIPDLPRRDPNRGLDHKPS